MRYSLFCLLFLLGACAKVEAPALYTVPPIPSNEAPVQEGDDSVSKDEISEIIKKREELLSIGE
jgi:hypothetical protein